MKVAIACGGTGGHIFPGIAVGEGLRARGHQVTLWLGGRRVEDVSASIWDGPVERVTAVGFPSGFSLRAVAVAWRLCLSILVCYYRLQRARPDVVLAMGSYASIGPGVAARLLRIPLVVHESNAIPGKAALLLSRWARVTALGFEAAASCLGHVNTEVTGFPLRAALTERPPLVPPDTERLTILVMGGSLGAHAINELASHAICSAVGDGVPLRVIHLSGKADAEEVTRRYAAAGVPATVCAFLADMGAAYRAADLAICRAGAASCAELAACRVPALLIPLPTAARDHQRANAAAMVQVGAADMLDQNGLSTEQLLDYIKAVHREPQRLDAKRTALATMHAQNAVANVCELLEEVA